MVIMSTSAAMKNKEHVRKIGILIKIIRKSHKLTQIELAKIMECSQSSISKFEEGHLEISALEMIKFCQTLKLPYEIFEKCYIDNQQLADINPRNLKIKTKIPLKYGIDGVYNLRAVKPILNYLSMKYGEDLFSERLQNTMDVSLDINYLFDLQVNGKFITDLYDCFEIGNNDFNLYLENSFCRIENHGDFHAYYEKSNSLQDVIKRYVKKHSYYQAATLLEVEGEDQGEFKVKLKTLHRDELLLKNPDYYVRVFQSLQGYLPSEKARMSSIVSLADGSILISNNLSS